MPYSSSWFSPKELFISRIERCIPRKWKKDFKQIIVQQNQLLDIDCKSQSRKIDTTNKLMVYPLLASLKQFISQGDIQKAFRAFASIQLHLTSSVDLIVDPISSLLVACSNLKLLQQGRQLHAHIIILGFGQHSLLLPKLVTLYSSFNLLPQAHLIAKNSSLPHPLAWNILISSYIRNGLCKEALSIYKEMLDFRISPDEFTYPSVLKACGEQADFTFGRQLHAHIIIMGFGQHSLLLPKLVTLYSSFNLLPQAHFIAKNSSLPHPLAWNILISSYIRNGLCKEALSIYKEMLDFGISPDEFTYPSVLKACGEQADLAFGREIHKSILAGNCGRSLCVQNALISMYGKCGEIEVARDLFDKLPYRDAFSWNSMISVHASKHMWDQAFELFEQMRLEGTELNIITWNTIIGGFLQTRNYKAVLDNLSQMRVSAMNLDAVSVVSGFGACSHIGTLKLGKEIHAASIRGGYGKFQNIQNAMITMYSRCQDHKHAHIVFREMEDKDIISWNSIISGYSHVDKSEEAFFLFRDMLLTCFRPNCVTIASILPLCARIANLQHGKELHCYIIKHQEFSDCLLLSNSLIDLYARAGKIYEAKRVFDSLTEKDVSTYTSLITGYGVLGEGEVALKLFEKMDNSGIKPDHVTMVAILAACSHSGLVTQGHLLFEKMWSTYGIRPLLEHYACMVDLYGRAGLLKKAKEIIKTMPYQPSPDMWATLLGACHIHRNTELGELAAEKLLAMRPKNSGYYVLIANMYASAGCWDKLATVRTLMRNLGVIKPPGCAWIDMGSGFEPFLVGDESAELSHEIYSLLEELTEQMKDATYVPEYALLDYEDFLK